MRHERSGISPPIYRTRIRKYEIKKRVFSMAVEIILRSFVPPNPSRRVTPSAEKVRRTVREFAPSTTQSSVHTTGVAERENRPVLRKGYRPGNNRTGPSPGKDKKNAFNNTRHRIAHHQVWRPFTRGRHADRVVWTSFFSGQDSQNEERQTEKTIFPAAHPARDDL